MDDGSEKEGELEGETMQDYEMLNISLPSNKTPFAPLQRETSGSNNRQEEKETRSPSFKLEGKPETYHSHRDNYALWHLQANEIALYFREIRHLAQQPHRRTYDNKKGRNVTQIDGEERNHILKPQSFA